MIRENNSELLSINNKVTLYFSLGHQTGVVLSKQVTLSRKGKKLKFLGHYIACKCSSSI